MDLESSRGVFSNQEQYGHYEEEVGRCCQILQTQHADTSERKQTITHLSQLILDHQEELLPQEKEKTLECLSHITRSDQVPSCRELILSLLGNERWTHWKAQNCAGVIHSLSTIPENHLPQGISRSVICPAFNHFAFLLISDSSSRAEDCISVLRDLGQLAEDGRLRDLSEENQNLIQDNVCALLFRLKSLDLDSDECSDALLSLGRLAGNSCLKGILEEGLCFFQKHVISLLSLLEHQHPDAQDCARALVSLGTLAHLGYLEQQEKNSSLQKTICSLICHFRAEGPYTKKCSDVLVELGHLVQRGHLKNLPNKDRISLSKSICDLTSSGGDEGPNTEQCSEIFWSLGQIAQCGLLQEIDETAQESLQKGISNLLSSIRNKNPSAGECSQALTGLSQLVDDGCLNSCLNGLSEEEECSFRGSVDDLISIFLDTTPGGGCIPLSLQKWSHSLLLNA